MEKFKELNLEELCFTNGGMDEAGMQLFHDVSETWWCKSLVALNDAADFISGLGDGFINGFTTTNSKW